MKTSFREWNMLPVSVLDLSPINVGATIAESFAHSVELAQTAERLGYKRIWFAEHHNTEGFASSAPEISMAHFAVLTKI